MRSPLDALVGGAFLPEVKTHVEDKHQIQYVFQELELVVNHKGDCVATRSSRRGCEQMADERRAATVAAPTLPE